MKALTALFAILTLGVFIVGVSLASPGTAPSASQFSQEASDSSQSTIKGGRLGESAMQFSPILRLAEMRRKAVSSVLQLGVQVHVRLHLTDAHTPTPDRTTRWQTRRGLDDHIFKIFKNFQFMFSWRYWSRIQDFRKLIRRIFRICRAPSFPKKQDVRFSTFEISKNNFVQKRLGISSLSSWSHLVSPKLNIIGWHVHQVRKPWKWWIVVFPQGENETLLV